MSLTIEVAGKSDVGSVRKNNEDNFGYDTRYGIFVVCDGMGGQAAGEVASKMSVDAVLEYFRRDNGNMPAGARRFEGVSERANALGNAILKANATVYKASRQGQSDHAGMGSTIASVLVRDNFLAVGHVGDSRVYLFRSGRAHQLTEDHTIIQEQLKRGLITKEQVPTAGNKNVITRAVGIQPSVAVDTLVTDVLPGDLFLLCSDGLHGYLHDDELAQLLAQERPKLPDLLVDLANQRGGKDNITAVCIGVGLDEDEEHTDVEGKTEILRRIPLFQHMTYKELLAIFAVARGRQFEKAQVIIREGEQGTELFVLMRGKVDVSKSGLKIAQLKAGGHFGEMGLVDQAPRSATVVAAEDTSAISIDRESLLKLMRRDSLLAVKLLWSFVQVLSERLRNANEALTDLHQELDTVRPRTTEPSLDKLERPGSSGLPPFGQ